MGIFLLGLGGFALVNGLLRDNFGLVFIGVLLPALAAFMFSVLWSVNRGAIEITVGPDGVAFQMLPPKAALFRWADPKFGIKLIERSADVNRTLDPNQRGSTYQLFTGSGSGMGNGPRIFTSIPPDCFEWLLRSARVRGLRVLVGTEGAPGTVSERRTYRVLAP